MRINILHDWRGRIRALDYKKVIIVVFLLRVSIASAYDLFVSIKGTDVILPDSKYYSAQGLYISSILSGNDASYIPEIDFFKDGQNRIIYRDIFNRENGRLPACRGENGFFAYVVGLIYFVFGYFPIGVRIFNIMLSMASAYFMFMVARRNFGTESANLFLLVALFLPTQFGYSITMGRDMLKLFVVSLISFVIYG